MASRFFIVVVISIALVGCSADFPRDPNGTLDRLSSGTMKVGVSHHPPWVDLTMGQDPTGVEVKLAEEFAKSRNATVEWVVGGEERLITLLKQNEIDLAIGGFTDSSPWSSQAALTTAYTQALGSDGKSQGRVMAVPQGENALLVALEHFLLSQKIEP